MGKTDMKCDVRDVANVLNNFRESVLRRVFWSAQRAITDPDPSSAGYEATGKFRYFGTLPKLVGD